MTLSRLWAFLAVGLPVLAALLANLSSVDLAYHLRAGQMILDTGRIPTTDTWTFTAAESPTVRFNDVEASRAWIQSSLCRPRHTSRS